MCINYYILQSDYLKIIYNNFSNGITAVRLREFIEIIAGNARRDNKGITKHAHTFCANLKEIFQKVVKTAPLVKFSRVRRSKAAKVL